MTDEQRQREAAEHAALYEFLTRESEFYRGRTRELEVEVKALRAQVAELQALGVSLHKAADAGAQAEGAAVVAWLREWQNTMDDRITHDDLDYAIAVIERGEHRRRDE